MVPPCRASQSWELEGKRARTINRCDEHETSAPETYKAARKYSTPVRAASRRDMNGDNPMLVSNLRRRDRQFRSALARRLDSRALPHSS